MNQHGKNEDCRCQITLKWRNHYILWEKWWVEHVLEWQSNWRKVAAELHHWLPSSKSIHRRLWVEKKMAVHGTTHSLQGHHSTGHFRCYKRQSFLGSVMHWSWYVKLYHDFQGHPWIAVRHRSVKITTVNAPLSLLLMCTTRMLISSWMSRSLQRHCSCAHVLIDSYNWKPSECLLMIYDAKLKKRRARKVMIRKRRAINYGFAL